MSATSVRIFLCTTFRDMQAERRFLHTQVFPKIAAWYSRKRLDFQVVDLGWDLPARDAEGFDQLKRSLDELERCRPFVVGLVGQRYGRGLEKMNREVVDAHPAMLKARKGMSRMHL